MNPTEYKISVMQAYLQGKPIEYCWYEVGRDGLWQLDSSPAWSWSIYTYRIATPVDPYAELKAAHAAGKVIQGSIFNDKWYDIETNIEWLLPVSFYRIKPDPVKSPLTPNDIPGICWIRSIPKCINAQPVEMMVSAAWEFGISCHDSTSHRTFGFEEMMDKMEYSTDRIKWSPCFIENDK